MLWSHLLPGHQVQFQLSLIVITNVCAGENSSLHPFINQGKNSLLIPGPAALYQHSHNNVTSNILLGLYLARSLRLWEIKQHIDWMAAICVGSEEGHQRHTVSSLYRSASNC